MLSKDKIYILKKDLCIFIHGVIYLLKWYTKPSLGHLLTKKNVIAMYAYFFEVSGSNVYYNVSVIQNGRQMAMSYTIGTLNICIRNVQAGYQNVYVYTSIYRYYKLFAIIPLYSKNYTNTQSVKVLGIWTILVLRCFELEFMGCILRLNC